MVETVLSKLPATLLLDRSSVSVRLYGGWYNQHRMSRIAASLSAQVAQIFPAVVRIPKAGTIHRIRAQVALAISLSVDPRTILTHTFRVRHAPSNLSTKSTPLVGCIDESSCPLSAVHYLLDTDAYPQSNCAVSVADVLTRTEQKMVDTMLTVDLVHLCLQGAPSIVIVTSDDDFWPAIKLALYLGVTVYHVRSRGPSGFGRNHGKPLTRHYLQYTI